MYVPNESEKFLKSMNSSIFQTPFEIKEKNLILKAITKKGVTISINGTMYVDSDCDITSALITHEAMHYIDQCKYDDVGDTYTKSTSMFILFILKYFFPIWVGVIMLAISLFIGNCIMFGISFIFTLPNPLLSFYRRKYEMRGYFFNWYMKDHRDYKRIFSSMMYYIMMLPKNKSYFDEEFSKMLALRKQDERFVRLFIFVKLK